MIKSDQLVKMLQERKFAVLTQEDVTEEYYKLILEGWTNCVRTIKKLKKLGNLTNSLILDLLDEAELWGRRASILKSGQVRFLRIHAMKSLT